MTYTHLALALYLLGALFCAYGLYVTKTPYTGWRNGLALCFSVAIWPIFGIVVLLFLHAEKSWNN